MEKILFTQNKKELNINESLLTEATRNDLVNKGRRGSNYSSSNQHKGKNRFERKRHSRVGTSVSSYNNIDMNSFFKKDILTVGVPVKGETSDYMVRMKFSGVLDEIQQEIVQNNYVFDFRIIYRALCRVFNKGDVYMHCSCPDWKYRFQYWSNVNNYGADPNNPGPGLGIANPNDDKGSGCKHSLLVLANQVWLLKVASVISNYIHYTEEHMEKQFLEIIFPKIYGMQPDKAYQLTLFDNRNYLKHSRGLIDAINDYGKSRGKFKSKLTPLNNITFNQPKKELEVPNNNQLQLDFDTIEEPENSLESEEDSTI